MNLNYLKDKSVLITGGTGTVGSFCVKELLEKSKARRVIVFSRDEFKQNKMFEDLKKHKNRLRFFLGNIRDKNRLNRAFKNVDYIIHTAALKHVDVLEYNPFEAVQTNILGTQNVIDAAIDQKVKKILLISTDKSANPTSLYGATKLCSEKLTVGGNFYASPNTKLSVIRFGNIFGSRGSFVESIKKQSENGSVNLTHEEMTRFWITVEHCTNLILKILGNMCGGEIIVPKLPSMKIKDFIMCFAPKSKINIIGIRPGEKIHEVLLTEEESRHSLEFEDQFIIFPEDKNILNMDKYSNGKKIDDNFVYISNKNSDWINCDILKEMQNQLL